jgi:hypothetical protein
LTDLDELLLKCRTGKSKRYITEAVQCYRAGAYRAAVVMTWLAVVFDLFEKLRELDLAGDANARTLTTQLDSIITRNDKASAMQFERDLLQKAHAELELFDDRVLLELERLRDDRNHCAHPSMLDAETHYAPSAEAVRYHLANAVEHLIRHGPSQGKSALVRLDNLLEASLFPSTQDELVEHLRHGPLGHPRQALLRNYLVILLKALFRERPLANPARIREILETGDRDERRLNCISATVQLHRNLALPVLDEKFDGLVTSGTDSNLSLATSLCARVPEVWMMLSRAQQNRTNRYVREGDSSSVTILVDAWQVADLRASAQERLTQATRKEWATLAAQSDGKAPIEWVRLAIDQLESAGSYDDSNARCDFLARNVETLAVADVDHILQHAKANNEVRQSHGFPRLLRACQTRDVIANYSTEKAHELGLSDYLAT